MTVHTCMARTGTDKWAAEQPLPLPVEEERDDPQHSQGTNASKHVQTQHEQDEHYFVVCSL